MNSDVAIRDSSIEGRGLYANREFKKGEIVVKWHSKRLSNSEFEELSDKERTRYVYKLAGVYYLMQSPERYVNH